MFDGISFFGHTITTSKNKLEVILGKSDGPSSDGKTNYNWLREYNGIIYSVYDWKEYRDFSDDELIDWHIGAKNKANSASICLYLLDLLKDVQIL